MITVANAIQQIAERTVENRERWKQALRQRRTEYTDIYGIPYESELTNAKKTSEYHIRISPDLEYYERFQFKLVVQTETEGATIDAFRIWVGTPKTEDDPENMVELTPYFEEQQNEWVTSSGYYPEEDDGDSDAGAFYDVLDACSLLTAEEKYEDVDAILEPGNKVIRIKADTPCDVTLQLFLKYSTVNR